MNFEYSEKEEIFRREVKDWLNETLPKSLSEKVKKYQRLTRSISTKIFNINKFVFY